VWKASSHRQWTAEFDACMTSIPYTTGYSPKRWQNCTDAMILKKAGLRTVDNLHTIILFEADFNYMNKYIEEQ